MRYFMHYKNKPYRWIGESIHSETMEPLVVYECLYDNPTSRIWVRPKKMFFENVTVDGVSLPRFREVPFELIAPVLKGSFKTLLNNANSAAPLEQEPALDPRSIQRVSSGAPWEAKVGYCRALRVGATIAVTGTAAVDSEGKVFAPGDARAQTRRCFEIIDQALQQLGASRRHVLRTRMFVTDISRWREYGEVHGEFFAEFPPATSMIEIKSLIDPQMLIEIEADALVH